MVRSKRGNARRVDRMPGARQGFLAVAVIAGLVNLGPIGAVPPMTPQDGTAELRRGFPLAEFGVGHPQGMALIDGRVAVFAEHAPDATTLSGITTGEDFVGTMALPRLGGRIATAFDPTRERVVVFDQTDLITIGSDQLWRTDTSLETRSLRSARIADPRGATFVADGDLAVLDARAREIVVLEETRGDGLRRIPIPHLGEQLRGLAHGPSDGLLYIASLDRRVVYAIDGAGMIHAGYDLGDAAIRDVHAIAIGPSADHTDAADALSLFVAAETGRAERDDLVEFTLRTSTNEGDPAPAAAVSEEDASLIQAVDLSRLSSPSPDPAGIAYIQSSDQFLIADGEVEEMSIYDDANLFRISRATGHLIDTGTTASPNPEDFSDEPVGAAFDPATATLILSDDDDDEISLVRAGRDGRYGTRDDPVSEFDVRSLAGSQDPEGVAFDTDTGNIFVTDGVGSEVYRIDAGRDGTFGNRDDVTSHWDMDRYGTEDPEGIAYSALTRTLFVLDRASIVYEVDTNGVLIRTIDCSDADAVKPGGLEIAPSSTNPSVMSLWIADRGVDNDSDSDENDGMLFELTLPSMRPPPAPPTVRITSPSNGSSHGVGTSISFAGSASDEDDGSLSGSLRWTSDRDGSIGRGASFTRVLSEGTHTITASVTDSDDARGRASITLTVRDQPPRITIASPTNGAWFASGSVISFSGTATDPEDGTLTSSLAWTSSIDGEIGTGGSLRTNLRDGVHVITASATDSRGATGTTRIKISVGVPRTVSVTLARGRDDAEEIVSTGAVTLNSSDLVLGVGRSSAVQRVGLRFRVSLPPGAQVTSASVQFRTDKVSMGRASLSIRGQAIDDAPAFRRSLRNIGSRALTKASVAWSPPAWPKVGAAGPDQRTPNIAPILRKIFARPGWTSGNRLVLVITGAGRRTADSFEEGRGAPILRLRYR